MKQSPAEQTMTVEEMISLLCKKLSALRAGERYLIGVVGYPGAGKSTVSEWLEAGVNRQYPSNAKVVPMDGYHLSNEKLDQLQLRELKGIPDTFDASSFIELLRRLRTTTDKDVFCPRFDRSIEASIEDAIVISPEHRLCIVEGNYLLLDKAPWHECKPCFDEVWFLDVTFDAILPRLIARHIAGGRTAEGAKAKVDATDLPNARLIEQTKSRADRVINVVEEKHAAPTHFT
jgi:pantothenate kinase